MSEQQGEFEMMMPFVVVESKGGPYDDAAYVAGCELGRLHAQLDVAKSIGLPLPEVVLHVENVPQADLLAMHVGARMRVEEWGDDVDDDTAAEWAHVVFEWPPVDDGPYDGSERL